VRSASSGVDFSRTAAFGHQGYAFVAQFGDLGSDADKLQEPVGFKIVMVDPQTAVITDFAVNDSAQPGPASRVGGGGLERPMACRFDPAGTALWVVDSGVMNGTAHRPEPKAGTGALWKITRQRSSP
jgi:hypothetical protein